MIPELIPPLFPVALREEPVLSILVITDPQCEKQDDTYRQIHQRYDSKVVLRKALTGDSERRNDFDLNVGTDTDYLTELYNADVVVNLDEVPIRLDRGRQVALAICSAQSYLSYGSPIQTPGLANNGPKKTFVSGSDTAVEFNISGGQVVTDTGGYFDSANKLLDILDTEITRLGGEHAARTKIYFCIDSLSSLSHRFRQGALAQLVGLEEPKQGYEVIFITDIAPEKIAALGIKASATISPKRFSQIRTNASMDASSVVIYERISQLSAASLLTHRARFINTENLNLIEETENFSHSDLIALSEDPGRYFRDILLRPKPGNGTTTNVAFEPLDTRIAVIIDAHGSNAQDVEHTLDSALALTQHIAQLEVVVLADEPLEGSRAPNVSYHSSVTADSETEVLSLLAESETEFFIELAAGDRIKTEGLILCAIHAHRRLRKLAEQTGFLSSSWCEQTGSLSSPWLGVSGLKVIRGHDGVLSTDTEIDSFTSICRPDFELDQRQLPALLHRTSYLAHKAAVADHLAGVGHPKMPVVRVDQLAFELVEHHEICNSASEQRPSGLARQRETPEALCFISSEEQVPYALAYAMEHGYDLHLAACGTKSQISDEYLEKARQSKELFKSVSSARLTVIGELIDRLFRLGSSGLAVFHVIFRRDTKSALAHIPSEAIALHFHEYEPGWLLAKTKFKECVVLEYKYAVTPYVVSRYPRSWGGYFGLHGLEEWLWPRLSLIMQNSLADYNPGSTLLPSRFACVDPDRSKSTVDWIYGADIDTEYFDAGNIYFKSLKDPKLHKIISEFFGRILNPRGGRNITDLPTRIWQDPPCEDPALKAQEAKYLVAIRAFDPSEARIERLKRWADGFLGKDGYDCCVLLDATLSPRIADRYRDIEGLQILTYTKFDVWDQYPSIAQLAFDQTIRIETINDSAVSLGPYGFNIESLNTCLARIPNRDDYDFVWLIEDDVAVGGGTLFEILDSYHRSRIFADVISAPPLELFKDHPWVRVASEEFLEKYPREDLWFSSEHVQRFSRRYLDKRHELSQANIVGWSEFSTVSLLESMNMSFNALLDRHMGYPYHYYRGSLSREEFKKRDTKDRQAGRLAFYHPVKT